MRIMSKDCNKNPNLFGKHPRQKENKKKYEGMILKSKNFGEFKIVNYVSSTYVEVEFTLSKFKHHSTLQNWKRIISMLKKKNDTLSL